MELFISGNPIIRKKKKTKQKTNNTLNKQCTYKKMYTVAIQMQMILLSLRVLRIIFLYSYYAIMNGFQNYI